MANSTRFSPSKGWDQVSQWLRTHTQALVALAGVFFLLPSLVLSFFGPVVVMPAIDPNSDPAIVIEVIQAAVAPLIPWIVILTLIQMVGQLAVMVVASRGNGASVGEAISIGFSRFGYLILAQIVLGLIFGILTFVVMMIVGMVTVAVPALGILFFIAGLAALIYVGTRLSLVAAVLVTEDLRWPIPLLRRSWELTAGNVLMIFLFFLIVIVVFVIISLVVSFVFGSLLAIAGTAGLSVLELLVGIVSAAGTVIFTLMSLAVWQQATGGDTPDVFN